MLWTVVLTVLWTVVLTVLRTVVVSVLNSTDSTSGHFLMTCTVDGSTDSGNVEEELFLVVYFDAHANDKKVHVRNRFFAVRKLASGDADGLFECVKRAMQYMGMGDGWEKKMVGFGSDGAAVNIADGGLKGHLQTLAPWMEMVWCLAHRLELALKDALKDTFFSSIDEMLLRLYLLYEKSPKNVVSLRGSLRNSSSACLLLICPLKVVTDQFVLVAHVLCVIK